MKIAVMVQRVYGEIMQHILEKPRDCGCLIWREKDDIMAGKVKDCGGKR